MEYEVITKTYEIYGVCQPFLKGAAIGVSIIISVKLFVNLIFRLRRCKCNDRRREEKV